MNDVFIEPKIVLENAFKEGDEVKGKAILSFNKKRNEWGWKAIILNTYI